MTLDINIHKCQLSIDLIEMKGILYLNTLMIDVNTPILDTLLVILIYRIPVQSYLKVIILNICKRHDVLNC